MQCVEPNNEGRVDYMEFTERFHTPAKDIGFNMAVLLTNLKVRLRWLSGEVWAADKDAAEAEKGV